MLTAQFINSICCFIAVLVLTISTSLGDYAPYHEQNFSCGKQSSEVGRNCTNYGKYGAVRCYEGVMVSSSFSNQKASGISEDIVVFCGLRNFNPITDLKIFPKIRNLTIEYSDVAELVEFPDMFYLQIINISWTNLSHIGPRTFRKVHPLRIVDLRWNRLVQLDSPFSMPRSFQSLFLSGNPWNCTRNLKWLLVPEKANYVIDRNLMKCADRKYNDRNVTTVMNYKVMLRNACQNHEDLKNCSCSMHHIIPKSHLPLYTVNCSHLGFTRLPNFLPENTTMLFANHNQISDISPLRNNIHYHYVVDVHLDNNIIENIDVLEGGYWLEHFRLLSLRNNRLKKVPVYALDNALDNANANLLLLSNNPWICSCKFAMRFREIIIKYNDILRDSWNITCTYVHDNEEKISKILAITREDICKPMDESKLHMLDWINGILATMILFILGKLAYDYYYYKNYGRVPWIVMKLP